MSGTRAAAFALLAAGCACGEDPAASPHLVAAPEAAEEVAAVEPPVGSDEPIAAGEASSPPGLEAFLRTEAAELCPDAPPDAEEPEGVCSLELDATARGSEDRAAAVYGTYGLYGGTLFLATNRGLYGSTPGAGWGAVEIFDTPDGTLLDHRASLRIVDLAPGGDPEHVVQIERRERDASDRLVVRRWLLVCGDPPGPIPFQCVETETLREVLTDQGVPLSREERVVEVADGGRVIRRGTIDHAAYDEETTVAELLARWTPTLTAEGLGPYRLGMSEAEIAVLPGARFVEHRWEVELPGVYLRTSGGMLECIDVFDAAVQTAEGIGLGTAPDLGGFGVAYGPRSAGREDGLFVFERAPWLSVRAERVGSPAAIHTDASRVVAMVVCR